MMNVAPLRPADLPALVKISREAGFGESWTDTALRDELEKASSLGIFSGEGRLEAFLFYRGGGEDVEVTWLATAPELRGQGRQRLLFQDLNAQCHKSGFRRILLEVRSDNTPALSLYRSLGFLQIHRRPRYYPGGQDALVLARDLTPP